MTTAPTPAPGLRRTLTALLGNAQRLDGGAMFGNAPRALWSRWVQPDEQNRIPLACRAMLIEEERGSETRRVLFEAGIGAFFDPSLKARYGVAETGHVLLDRLASLGLGPDDIDLVVLSHLHFDHAGGLLTPYDPGTPPRLCFPRARILTSRAAFERAADPHPRDRASYIPELPGLLRATERLQLIEEPAQDGRAATSDWLGEDYRFHFSHGHTPGLLLTEVPSHDGRPVVFVSDLIPGRPWVHVPITMGYDRFPELLIDEKTRLLRDLVARRGRLFFTHDPSVALATVELDQRGRFTVGESWPEPVRLPL